MREVYEETGIKTEFKEILAFRETKDYRYGNSDIYYVALLEALTTDFNLCS